MILDFANLTKGQAYQVMTHCIIPRPVAWILTENENGSHNLAPYSYFQAIGSEPPTVMVSMGFKPGGVKKDTLINIERSQHYVIHIANCELADAVNLSAKPITYNESEVELCGLQTEAVDGWPMSRIQQAPVAFHCRLIQVDLISGMNVVYGEILHAWIDDNILAPAPMANTPDLPEADKLNPLARLGYMSYASLGELFERERPN